MTWYSRLFGEWESARIWDQIAWLSGIISLILIIINLFNWARGNISAFFIMSYIAIIITAASAIYSNILKQREINNLKSKIDEEETKADKAVDAVYAFKNKELEDYRKNALLSLEGLLEFWIDKRHFVDNSSTIK